MKILFVFAHPDDEAYGPAGTINKLAQNHEVEVFVLCRGDRFGNEEVSRARIKQFKESCDLLGAKGTILNHSDCNLTYNQVCYDITKKVVQFEPDVVYTHSNTDIHLDHRLVSEATMVACRPTSNSTVNALYMCEIPSSTDWSFGKINGSFAPNVYKDVSNFIHKKQQVMSLYKTELHDYPDARSTESMEVLAMHRGKQIGVHRAEAFQLVFSHDRGIQ